MKHKILLISILFSALMYEQTYAQRFMKVTKTDNTFAYYPIADIQKITFSNLTTGNSEMTKKTAMIFSQLKGFPNPASDQFTLEYTLTENTPVVIKIYNIKGELVKQLEKGNMNIGKHSFVWDTKDNTGGQVSNGTYMCQVITKEKLLTKKVIIINN